jgi:hypothetical protein
MARGERMSEGCGAGRKARVLWVGGLRSGQALDVSMQGWQ